MFSIFANLLKSDVMYVINSESFFIFFTCDLYYLFLTVEDVDMLLVLLVLVLIIFVIEF